MVECLKPLIGQDVLIALALRGAGISVSNARQKGLDANRIWRLTEVLLRDDGLVEIRTTQGGAVVQPELVEAVTWDGWESGQGGQYL